MSTEQETREMQAEIAAKLCCYTERQQDLYRDIIVRGIETKWAARRRRIEYSLDF